MRASNIIYETPEGRPIWKLRPVQMLVTLVVVLLVAVLALALVLTGPIVDAVAGLLGITSTATTIWDIAKRPVMLLTVLGIIAVLYYASPNVKLRGFKWVTPGTAIAVVVWLIASAAFAFSSRTLGPTTRPTGRSPASS